ncbi:hypothetical protein D3C78_1375860 [compost metagenome]
MATALSHFLSSITNKPVLVLVLMPNCARDFKVPVPDRALNSLRSVDCNERMVASPVSAAEVALPSAFLVTLVSAFMALSKAL